MEGNRIGKRQTTYRASGRESKRVEQRLARFEANNISRDADGWTTEAGASDE